MIALLLSPNLQSADASMNYRFRINGAGVINAKSFITKFSHLIFHHGRNLTEGAAPLLMDAD
jgi:hypothetical protein